MSGYEYLSFVHPILCSFISFDRYYPRGHRLFLEAYPDILGKKTRSTTRVTLWEKAELERKEFSENGKMDADKKWWDDEWLDNFQNSYDRYPILCRVRNTYAEFPPDRYTKVIKNDKVYWKSPKVKKAGGDLPPAVLRLAVTLQPLTPVLPPSCDGGTKIELAIPPIFSVQTFPSQMDPFLVPFSWAYSSFHSLRKGQRVWLKGFGAEHFQIVSFESLHSQTSETFRIEDNMSDVHAFFNDHGGDVKSQIKHLDGVASPGTNVALPSYDINAVLDTMRMAVGFNGPLDDRAINSSRFIALIRKTLPLWDSVIIAKNNNGKAMDTVSPWHLVGLDKNRDVLADHSPDRLASMSQLLDNGLRLKIECLIEDFVNDTPSTDIFYRPITEEIAPSYSCAVPVSMCLQKILTRLGVGTHGTARCFYRSIEAIISDLSAISENCILYNSPDSDLVNTAVNTIGRLKSEVFRLAQKHYREIDEMRKADEERRKLVLRQFNASVTEEESGEASLVPIGVFDTIRRPFKDHVYRGWLKELTTTAVSNDQRKDAISFWIPQAGDKIEYCPQVHAKFIQQHYRSLEPDQCKVVQVGMSHLSMEDSSCNEDWSTAKVAWTRACFPKALSKKSGDDAVTFPTNALLLAIGLQFEESSMGPIRVIFWRPCTFASDDIARDQVSSCCCMTAGYSFVRPAGFQSSDKALSSTLSEGEAKSMAECLLLLKRRCIRGKQPASLDTLLTKANIKQGYLPSQPKVSAKSLPKFEHLLRQEILEDDGEKVKSHETRGISARPNTVDLKAVQKLVESGFLPEWISIETGGENKDELRRQQSLIPNPSICLEAILARLENGYYRHREAVENDIVEAYASSAYLSLAASASRKITPLSIKRVARLMCTLRDQVHSVPMGEISTSLSQSLASRASKEELNWIPVLHLLRELHATALLSISDTQVVQRVFGLGGLLNARDIVSTPSSGDPDEDPQRAQARQRLECLLTAVGRDELSNSFGGERDQLTPIRKMRIISNNEPVKYEKIVKKVTEMSATTETGQMVSVKVRCGDEYVSVEKDVPPLSRATAVFEEEDVDVRIVCDDESITENIDAFLSRMIPRHRKDYFSVTEEALILRKEDFDGNEDLVRFFFGRPGRKKACARCYAHRRSLLSCRVHRAHSNIDFDWIETFRGYNGLNSLLHALHPHMYFPSSVECRTESTNKDIEGPDEDIDNEDDADERKDDRNGTEDQDADDEEEGNVNVQEQLDLALKAQALSIDVVEEARAYAEAPHRLNKDFIDKVIPVDPSDGHLIYCIICGLSGDLICCDGCSNVLHKSCIGVTTLPDGDWFCEECVLKSKENQLASSSQTQSFDNSTADDNAMVLDVANSIVQRDESIHVKGRLPFDRFDFNDDRAIELHELLEKLRTSHPDGYRKKRGEKTRKMDDTENKQKEERRRIREKNVIFKDDLSDFEGEDDESVNRDSDDDDWRRPGHGVKTRKSSKHTVINDPIDTLSETIKKFLKSVRITTMQALLDAKSGDIAKQFGRWRKKQGLPKLHGTGEIASVSTWKAACRKAAEKMNRSDMINVLKNERRGRKNRGNSPKGRKRKFSELQDPIDVLSDMNREFLSSVDIHCAEDLLRAPTSLLAKEYGAWRKRQGLSKLAGNGDGASISSWKALCRKTAVDMGKLTLSEIQAESMHGSPRHMRPGRSRRGRPQSTPASSGTDKKKIVEPKRRLGRPRKIYNSEESPPERKKHRSNAQKVTPKRRGRPPKNLATNQAATSQSEVYEVDEIVPSRRSTRKNEDTVVREETSKRRKRARSMTAPSPRKRRATSRKKGDSDSSLETKKVLRLVEGEDEILSLDNGRAPSRERRAPDRLINVPSFGDRKPATQSRRIRNNNGPEYKGRGVQNVLNMVNELLPITEGKRANSRSRRRR